MLERLGLLLGRRRSVLPRSTGHGEIAAVDAKLPARKAMPVKLLGSDLSPKSGVVPAGEVGR